MTDTDVILDSARYLREVRPIDPEEICEYAGGVHPAVVRQVLRDHAFELGLYEREDGTFSPLEEEPIAPTFGGVEAFPERYSRRLEDLLIRTYGPGWPEGDSGDALRTHIDRLKEAYFADESVTYEEETALAYAIYHLPDYYAAMQYVLAELASDGLLDRRLRVLDVGAGVGGPALGLVDFLPEASLLDYEAVEPSAAADVLETLLAETGPNVRTTIHRETAEAFDPEGTYDLLVFGNVLSELSDPVSVLRRYAAVLDDDATLLALSPAEKRTATRLRSIERAVVDDGQFTVYAPTLRLWPDERPSDRGWTFTRKPDLAVPSFQRRLDDAADGDGTYLNVDVQFAYLLARLDGKQAIEYTPDRSSVAALTESEDHVTDRIDTTVLKLSPDLGSGNPLFKISDGSEAVDHYAVVARESALNEAILRAPYGSLLRIENGLLLWNDDEEAYNLVVDDETVVDRLA